MKSKWDDPITLATVVIAAATVINVFASLYIGKKTSDYTEITQNIYKASNRPYVGINSITATNDNENRKLFVDYKIKNYGGVPATGVRVNIDTKLDGFTMTTIDKAPFDMNCNIFPLNIFTYGQRIASNYDEIIKGTKVLDLVIQVKYYGITKDQYQNDEIWRYDIGTNTFFPIEATTK